jgi:CBS domain containing-hemolysin-like protein
MPATPSRSALRRMRPLAALALLLVSAVANASMFKGEALDKAADVIAIVVLIVVPVTVIVLFWLVHILPEKIAHKRNHPQQEAIQTLCLLSLVFGGLLWPLAWLWAYTKPVLYKMAYGTDQADEHHDTAADKGGEAPEHVRQDVARLRNDLEQLMSRGGAPAEFTALRDRLAAIERRLAGMAGEAG